MARLGFMISRVFATALARRLAALIFVGFLAWFGLSDAKAQANSCYDATNWGGTSTPTPCPSRPVAYAQLQVAASNFCSRYTCRGTQVQISSVQCAASVSYCTVSGKLRYKQSEQWDADYLFYRHWPKKADCPSGQEWNDLRASCQTPCSSRTTETVTYKQMIPNGSYSCSDGCTARISSGVDGAYFKSYLGGTASHCNVLPNDCSAFGAGYSMNFGTSMCQPAPVDCAENEVKDPISGMCTHGCEAGKIMDATGVCKAKEDQCPPGNVKSPSGGCLPGDGQCAAGEVKGKDGTCKRDKDGDGKPDAGEEEGTTDETFSGGDSCSAPPACSGSPIMCGQVRIQWRIDCNTRNDANVTGGSCSAMPVCIGKNCKAQEHASMIQQWQAKCLLEKIANKSSDSDGGQPEWTKVGGMNQNPASGELASDKPTIGEKEFKTDDLDSSGFGGGRCAGLASVSGQGVVGSSYAQTFASPPAAWCNFIGNLRASLIIISSALACFIIARGL